MPLDYHALIIITMISWFLMVALLVRLCWYCTRKNSSFVPDLDIQHTGRTICAIGDRRMTLVESTQSWNGDSTVIHLTLQPTSEYQVRIHRLPHSVIVDSTPVQ